MTIGIAKKKKIFYAKAGKPGNKVVYVGSKTEEMVYMALACHPIIF